MTTITIERELLEQVLNALLLPCDRWNGVQSRIVKEASDAVLSALAAPATAPEPFAYTTGLYGGRFTLEPVNPAVVIPKGFGLYLHPPKEKQPAWQDAPTKPGMWACLYMGELSTAIFNAYEIEHFDRNEMVGCRWRFIPEDKP